MPSKICKNIPGYVRGVSRSIPGTTSSKASKAFSADAPPLWYKRISGTPGIERGAGRRIEMETETELVQEMAIRIERKGKMSIILAETLK